MSSVPKELAAYFKVLDEKLGPIFRQHEKIDAIVNRAAESRAKALEAIAVDALKIDPEPSNWHWKVAPDGTHTLVHTPVPPVGYVYPDNGEFRR